MSQHENTGILKFFSKLSTKGEHEYLDHSTPRSHSQTRQPHKQVQNSQSHSYSLSPTTKRKQRLTELDNLDNSTPVKEQKRKHTMSSPQNQTPNPTPKDQAPPSELQSLREEMNAGFDRIEKKMHADFQELVTSLKDSIKELIKGLKECQELRMMNNNLQHRVNKVEQDNIKLNNKVQQLEDKLMEGNLVF